MRRQHTKHFVSGERRKHWNHDAKIQRNKRQGYCTSVSMGTRRRHILVSEGRCRCCDQDPRLVNKEETLLRELQKVRAERHHAEEDVAPIQQEKRREQHREREITRKSAREQCHQQQRDKNHLQVITTLLKTLMDKFESLHRSI